MKILVTFYSRTGWTKMAGEYIAAQITAAGHEAVTEEIIDKTPRSGVLGWFKAGRDAHTGRDTEIEPVKADVGAFDMVICGSPVWAWKAVPACKMFLTAHKDAVKKAAFYATMGGSGGDTACANMAGWAGKDSVATLTLKTADIKRELDKGYKEKVAAFVEAITGASSGSKEEGGSDG